MKIARWVAALACVVVVLSADIAKACYPACGWGSFADEQHVCAASAPKRDAALTCWCSGACAAACSGWCASWNGCLTSGVPSCVPSGGTNACDACVESSCAAETSACSADTTGCVSTCAAWLAGGAICDGGTNEELLVSDCACNGACANKCAASCLLSAFGDKYLDNSIAPTQQCTACLQQKNGCASAYTSCLAL